MDQPRSGVVYNFGRVCVCLTLCMYVCQTITFESLDVRSSYLHIRHITGAKKVENSYSMQCKNSIDSNSRSVKHRAVLFV